MLKRILSVLAGVAVAMVIISLLEMAGGKIYPPASASDFSNAQVLDKLMSKMPIGEFIWLLAGYAIGSFAGGITATLVSGRDINGPAVITGGIVMVGGILNLLDIPHPFWFSITSLLMYVPFAFLGYLVARKKS